VTSEEPVVQEVGAVQRPEAEAKRLPLGGERQARLDRYGDPLPPGAIARLGTLRLRHGDMVRNLGFSPDNKKLISADWHGVHVWDTNTGRHLRKFGDPRGRQFQSISFSEDGRTVALAMDQGDIDIWDVATGRRRHQFHIGRFSSVILSPDGLLLAGLEMDDKDRQSMHLWNARTGKEIHRFQGHEDTIHSIKFSSDGKMLISASDDKSIRFWDILTGKQVRRFDCSDSVGQIAVAPDGKTLASVNTKKNQGANFTFWRAGEYIVLWDIASGKEKCRLKGHKENGVSALAFHPNCKTLVSADWGTMYWWDVVTGKELPGPKLAAGKVVVLAFAPDG
jgi:WD40 repeat protein